MQSILFIQANMICQKKMHNLSEVVQSLSGGPINRTITGKKKSNNLGIRQNKSICQT